MPTSNKKKAKAARKNAASEPIAKKDQQPTPKPPIRGLAPPQLTSVCCLFVGAGYVMELNRTVNAGPSSDSCGSYFTNITSCNETDLFFIRCKYYTSLLAISLVFFMSILCWSKPPLLQRLNIMLCISPLNATLLVLMLSGDTLKPRRKLNYVMMAIILLVVAISSCRVGLAPLQWFRLSSIHDWFLLIFIIVNLVLTGNDLWNGPDKVTNFAADDISREASLVFQFLAVDRLTILLTIAHGLFFFDQVRKRIVLFSIGCLSLAEYFLQLPHLAENLRDIDIRYQNLLAAAVVAIILAEFPRPKALKNKTI